MRVPHAGTRIPHRAGKYNPMTSTSTRLRSVLFASGMAAAVSVACLSLFAQSRGAAPASPQTPAAKTAAPRQAQPRPRAVSRVEPRPIRVLFLGQDEERPHNPVKMFPLLA